MSAPTHTARPVEFYATSPRLARAFRRAARRHRGLARLSELHELEPGKVENPVDEAVKVVLSHADGDYLSLTDARMAPVVSGAFHLVFTEPATHPDQVARWMRATNIRSEDRLHVVRVDDLEAPQVSQLLGRVCFALVRDDPHGSIIDAYLADDSLFVRGPGHRMLHVPLSSLPALRGKSRDVLRNFVLDPDGSFVHWPEIDVHLGWGQFLQAVDPGELRRAQQRSKGYNQRYGAAIRRVREEAGLPQSRIGGLTDRQLRRIEQGESRATSAALATLAVAHGLDTNTYLERLAQAMR